MLRVSLSVSELVGAPSRPTCPPRMPSLAPPAAKPTEDPYTRSSPVRVLDCTVELTRRSHRVFDLPPPQLRGGRVRTCGVERGGLPSFGRGREWRSCGRERVHEGSGGRERDGRCVGCAREAQLWGRGLEQTTQGRGAWTGYRPWCAITDGAIARLGHEEPFVTPLAGREPRWTGWRLGRGATRSRGSRRRSDEARLTSVRSHKRVH